MNSFKAQYVAKESYIIIEHNIKTVTLSGN